MSLNRCPKCRYSLEGLPAEYACPECGLEYDACSFVHVPRMPRWLVVVLCGAYDLVAVAALFTAIFAPAALARRLPMLLYTLSFGGMAIWFFVMQRRGLGRVVFVPAGVWRRGLLGGWTSYHWAGIDEVRVRHGWFAAGVQLVGPNARSIGIGAGDLSRDELDQPAARIRLCIKQYKGARDAAGTRDD